jgi:hypothetical protein
MSSLHGAEDTIRMPPVSTAVLERVGEEVLSILCPEALQQPTAIDVLNLIEYVLPKHGIHFVPTDPVELNDCHAVTDPAGTGDIEVRFSSDLWDHLIEGGRRANLARSTAAHELVHALLHVPVIRRRRDNPQTQHLLQRVMRGEIKTYEDSEWQAYVLGGCILMPRRTISMVQSPTISKLAATYKVSEPFVMSHLKKLKLEVPMR